MLTLFEGSERVTELQTWLKRHGIVLVLLIAALLLTAPYYQGDTADYVGDVIAHIDGAHRGPWDPLWEFGHLLWRPTGLVLLKALKSVSPQGFGLPDHLLVTQAFIGISLASGIGLGLLMHSLALGAGLSRAAALAVTAVFMASNGVLNYMQTGNAYVTGLFFLTLGIWLMKRCMNTGYGKASAVAGGLALGASALFWFPYAFVLPAAVLIPVIFAQDGKLPYRQAAIAAAACGLLMAAVYACALGAQGIHSFQDAMAWVRHANHGVQPSRATAIRTVFGIPRAFIDMGDLGKLIKRFMYHDPYTRVSAIDLLTKAAAPLALFYGTAAALIWAAMRSVEGRRATAVFAIAAIPVTAFAVFIFEGGSMERFFPVYPFGLLLAAFALRNAGALRGMHRYMGAILLAVILVRSGIAMSPSRGRELQQEQAARISPARADVGSGFFAIVSNQDDLMLFAKTYPFHELNRPKAVPIYDVFEPGNARVLTWKQDFARRVERAWEHSGNVWVSKRLITEHPLPGWNWVEGDDPRLSWKAGVEFFKGFEYERDSDGDDGFVLLGRSENNRRRLDEYAGQEQGSK